MTKKITLTQEETEELVRRKLLDLERGELGHFAEKIGKTYIALNNFKNSCHQFNPTNLIEECLKGFGYQNIEKKTLVTFTFDEKPK